MACLFSIAASAQEFKFYFNGSTVEDSTYIDDFQKGDLMRVIFSGKATPYRFRIATIMVTLVPRNGSNNETINNPTSFVLDNASNEFSNYPTFTFGLLERIAFLKDNACDVTIKVNQLFSDTDEGSRWIENNVKFKAVTIQKRNKELAANSSQ
jgi:hypothetical protein